MWRGSNFLKGINFQFGRMLDINSDNSLSESLMFNYDENGEVTIKLMMSIFGQSEYEDILSVVKELWKSKLEPDLRR